MIEIRTKNLTLYHRGPPLEDGPLPSIFYFALSGPDTLTLDPINQLVEFIADRPIRCFSLTLPGHEKGIGQDEAYASWNKEILTPFFDEVLTAVDYVIEQKLANPHHLAIAGLSRGGLIASHVAAREPRFKTILQFAPVTTFPELDVHPLAPKLADRSVRIYIGNNDDKVGTRSCFEFAMVLTENSTHRSPQIELIISPSIGRKGHGTTPETFRSGALWLADKLQNPNV